MSASKSSIFMWIPLTLLLSACQLEKPQPALHDGEQNASFFVERQEAKFTVTRNHEFFSIPVQKSLSLKVCIKDNQFSKPIQNHNFEITGSQFHQTASSDASGCVVWNENLDYNHFASSQYLTLKRAIRSSARHQGQRLVEWIINPWENFAESNLDIKKPIKTVPAEQWTDALQPASAHRPLWIDDLRITVERSLGQGSSILKFQVRAEPKINLSNSAGDIIHWPLSQGKFKAKLYLINLFEEQGQTRAVVKAQSPELQIDSLNNGMMYLENKFELKNFRIPGQAALGIELEPLHAPTGLQAFSGVFIVSDIDNMVGNFIARLRTDSDLNKIKNERLVDTGPLNSSVLVSPLVFTHKHWNGQGLQRERIFEIEACLAHGLDRKPIPGHKLKIKTLDGRDIETEKSNLSGCVKWNEFLSFNFLQKETFLDKSIQISNSDLGLQETLKISVNPWSETSDFAYDLRWNQPPSMDQTVLAHDNNILTKRPLPNPEVAVPQRNLKTMIMPESFALTKEQFYDYDIDSSLNLILIKKISLTFNNVMIVKKSISHPSGNVSVPIPIGDYQIRFAIVDGSLNTWNDPQQWIGKIYHTEEILAHAYTPGVITIKPQIQIRDMKILGQTNQLLVQILPVSDKSAVDSLDDSVFSAAVLLSVNSESKNLSPVSNTPSNLLSQLKQRLREDLALHERWNKMFSSKEKFAQEQNLQLLNLNQDQSLQPLLTGLSHPMNKKTTRPMESEKAIGKSELQSWLSTGIASQLLSERLCLMWFYDQLYSVLQSQTRQDWGLARNCFMSVQQNRLKDFFDIEFRLIVKNPRLGDKQQIQPSRKDFMLNQVYQVQKGYSYSIAKAFSWDVSAGVVPLSPFKDALNRIPALGMLSASGGVRYQVSKTHTNADAYGNTIASIHSLNMTLNSIRLPVEFDSYEKCVAIRLNPNIALKEDFILALNPQMNPQQVSQKLNSGYLICQGSETPSTGPAFETYYTFNQKLSDDQGPVDAYSDNGRPYFASVRGIQDYLKFLGFIYQGMPLPDDHKAEFQSHYSVRDVNSEIFKRGLPAYPGHLIRDR